MSAAASFVLFVGILASLLLVPTAAHAADPPEDVAGFVGATSTGLPGIGRVAVASPREVPHVAATVGAGYGFTEAQAGESGAHHRASGTLGLAAQPLRFLAAALVLDGRFDKHPDDPLGSSTSAIGEPRLVVRAAEALGRSFALGGQLVWWVPGADAPSVRPEASTLDADLLATYAPPGADLAIALNAGYRIDRSAHTVDAPQRLRRGDRISLQSSDFDALLLGLGGSKRIGRVEVLGELTWDVLLGNNAPSAIESPLRAGAGARYQVTRPADAPDGLQIELRSEIGLGQRPGSDRLDALVPIEPRVAILAGLRFVLPLRAKARPPVAPPEGSPAPPAAAPPPPPAHVVGSVRGRVTGDHGEPVAGGQLTLSSPDADGDAEHKTQTGADGTFAIDDAPPGKARVAVKAAGYEDATAETTIAAGVAASLNIALKRAIRPGQLRGLVRSWSGKALAATIRVEPIGIEAKTDADGAFQIDVPPGAYQIIVAAPGHTGQRRPVHVEENGVTILNADLRQGQ